MPTNQMLQRVDIFISSPSDVTPEREIVLRVIERLNRLTYINEKYILFPLAYEHTVPPFQGHEPQVIVDQHMGRPENCYLMVCILWARMGTAFIHPDDQEHWESGTEYEYMSAYRAYLKHGEPQILLYWKVADLSSSEPEQLAKVTQFFQRFEGEQPEIKGLYKTYTDLSQFEEMLFHHIEQILAKSPPKAISVKNIEVPRMLEEERRVDAAMPQVVSVNQPTEVWVQICIPASEGFRTQLPTFTKHGDVITRQDVKENNLGLVFPIDPRTGLPKSTNVIVELRAPDFVLVEPSQEVLVYPQKDSGLIVFALSPTIARRRSILHVLIRQRAANGTLVTLGSAALSTEIHPIGVNKLAADIVWSILSMPLTAFSQMHPYRHSAEKSEVAQADHIQISIGGDVSGNINVGGRDISIDEKDQKVNDSAKNKETPVIPPESKPKPSSKPSTPPDPRVITITIDGNIGPGANIGSGSIRAEVIAGNEITVDDKTTVPQDQFVDLLTDLHKMIIQAQHFGELPESIGKEMLTELEAAKDLVSNNNNPSKSLLLVHLQQVIDLIDNALDNAEGSAPMLIKALPFAALLIKIANQVF